MYLLLIPLSVVAVRLSPAQTMPPTFSQHQYGILNYDLFIPSAYDSAKKYPLITYFHGYNDTVKKYFNWYDSSVQSVNPCFVFAPKCPPSDAQGWGNSWQDLFSTRLSLSFEVLDSLTKDYSIDTNCLYIYGTSMGGYGTLEALYRYPQKFAAAMVLCGGGNPATAAEVMKTPLWIFHGGEDNVVPISESWNLYNQMVVLGATKIRFTEYPTAGHEMWIYAPKEPAWPDWIFNFSRADTFNLRPNVPINLTYSRIAGSSDTLVIPAWNQVDNHKNRQNKIWYYKVFRNDSVIAFMDFMQTRYIDASPIDGLNVYRLTAVNYDFQESDSSNSVVVDNSTGILEDEQPPPQAFALNQNYPNPFNPSTTISFSLPYEAFVSLSVFDVLGREVSTIVNEELSAGNYSREWYAGRLPSGIYFYNLQAGAYSATKKVVLLK